MNTAMRSRQLQSRGDIMDIFEIWIDKRGIEKIYPYHNLNKIVTMPIMTH